jgi:hypothetical protein
MTRHRDDNPDRDTFDRMQPNDRGLFGDKEHAPSRGRVTGSSDLHDFTLVLVTQTQRAIGVKQDPKGPVTIWLPKSMIEYVEKPGGLVEVTMAERLAVEKGLM